MHLLSDWAIAAPALSLVVCGILRFLRLWLVTKFLAKIYRASGFDPAHLRAAAEAVRTTQRPPY
ncbi:hypothetical protein GCM10023321_78700 [Pseudonocardia eucalypti]|uniref:DUF418 domain-containing protein n=2 Tax=Pseudonocardia eucalypti TaxID=648755 RepID=A0ABP9RCB7_9PSEU